MKETWIICVDAEYLVEEFFETFTEKSKAQQRYEQLLVDYKEPISEDKVTIYFTKVEKIN